MQRSKQIAMADAVAHENQDYTGSVRRKRPVYFATSVFRGSALRYHATNRLAPCLFLFAVVPSGA